MARYTVQVVQTYTMTMDIEVTANSEDEARVAAVLEADCGDVAYDWDWSAAEPDVTTGDVFLTAGSRAAYDRHAAHSPLQRSHIMKLYNLITIIQGRAQYLTRRGSLCTNSAAAAQLTHGEARATKEAWQGSTLGPFAVIAARAK